MKLSIDVNLESIKNLGKDLKNYVKRSLESLSSTLPDEVKKVFEAEGARGDHYKWEPTTMIARLNRKSRNINNPTLVDTGAMRDSIDDTVIEELNNGNYVLVVGSDKDYSSLHQFGGTTTINGMTFEVPEREWLFFTDSDVDLVEQTFGDEEL